jgi:RsiW-degrading membrane proteinase PrsW (M82 family)
VAITVVWMLACLGTLFGVAVVLALVGLIRFFPAAAGQRHPLAPVAGTLLIVVLITGGLNLLLLPISRRVRQVPPPRAILWLSLLIGLVPWGLLVAWGWLIR